MNRKEKFFSRKIVHWYQKNARDLPFRRTRDPYKIWISEVMLQQTTMKAVISYYERWIGALPTVRHVAKASLRKILKLWEGLGYYQRARNIHKAAKVIVANHGGKIPRQEHQLRKLPGFGPYTTSAVMSIAFQEPLPVIDGNVRRVMMRYLAMDSIPSSGGDNDIDAFLRKRLPDKKISDFNQGLMELGALVCKKSDPLCPVCPLRRDCLACRDNLQNVIPRPKRLKLEDISVSIGIMKDESNSKVYIQKRPAGGLMGDLWEFPGGKIKKGEGRVKALKREFREELGITIGDVRHLTSFQHYYTRFRVFLHSYLCTPKNRPPVDNTRKWVAIHRLKNYPMPAANLRLQKLLQKT